MSGKVEDVPACKPALAAGVPSALMGEPIVKRAVCACCAHPAIVESKFKGLLSSCRPVVGAQQGNKCKA